MKTTKTVWSIFRDLVNSKSIGTEITRQEILNQVEKELVEIGKTVRDYKLGTVATITDGSSATASVVSSGTDTSGNPIYKINLGIPKGLKGDTGTAGTAGTNGTNGKDAVINVTSSVLGNNDSTTGNSTTIACSENIYYKIVAIGNGTITLNTPANSSVYNEYMLEISTTADVTLTFPSTLKWVKAITFTSGKTYQISIVNNIAVWASVTT